MAQGISIKEDRIEAVKTWAEPKSLRDIQIFLEFANFYQYFIQGFSKIAMPLISMLKISPAGAETPPKTADNSIFLTLKLN